MIFNSFILLNNSDVLCFLSEEEKIRFYTSVNKACKKVKYHIGDEGESMSSYHSSMKEFDPNMNDWIAYTEQLDFCFAANDVTPDSKKWSILLAACGAPTLKLIKSLVGNDKLKTTDYTEIVQLVKNYYVPPLSAIVQRYKFNTWV